MKNIIKLAMAATAGYFIGFYEMKYKVMKVMLENSVKDNSNKTHKEESK